MGTTEGAMDLVCELPDGRPLYHAPEGAFESPGFYTLDADGKQVKCELVVAGDDADTPTPPQHGAVFEVFPSEDGYRWRLKAANGEVIAQSEGYGTKEHAAEGAEAVWRAAGTARIDTTVTE